MVAIPIRLPEKKEFPKLKFLKGLRFFCFLIFASSASTADKKEPFKILITQGLETKKSHSLTNRSERFNFFSAIHYVVVCGALTTIYSR